jgi:hypothetical protein
MGKISFSARIQNDLVASTDNQRNYLPKPTQRTQIFGNFRPKKYFKKISKYFRKLPGISQNFKKVPKSLLGRKLASLIFGNNFEPHSHNGFRSSLRSEHPPSTRVHTAQ